MLLPSLFAVEILSWERLQEIFILYGYWVVFFGVMLENAGLPVPGETVLLAAGFFAADGHFDLPTTMAVAATGATIGDNIGFAIGQRFGRAALLKYGRYVLLTPARFDTINAFFAAHGDKTILVARFISGLRVFAALIAGASDMPWRRFAIFNMLGAVLWAVVITLAGYFFGNSWAFLARFVGTSGAVGLVVFVVAVVWYVKRRRSATAEN